MKKLITLLSVSIVFILFAISFNASAFDEPDGKQIFEDEKCNLCHSVSTVGIEAKTKKEAFKGPDLVNLADSFEADWIVKYLKKEADKDGKSHKKPFKGTDEELQALVDWLLEQKAEE
ncbi:MAG: cytochrome c [Ignavibacteria bacterium]|nr:cytochrome c [Ignavibacteria bacterium]